MNEVADKYGVLLFCVLGTIVRLAFGYLFHPWTESPDHLAWELVLNHGSFKYDHLIHYPHEGGTILVSILSHFISVFTDFSPLIISAFLLDFAVRFIQISIVKKVFNHQVALWFGLWTVFASPIIIPWGSQLFGLHSISSVFPFVLLFILFQKTSTPKKQIIYGVFLGLAIWFSYSNFILVPIYFLYNAIRKTKSWGFALLGFSAILVLHIYVRDIVDAGFHLTEFNLTTIRGVEFSLNELSVWDRFSSIPKLLANSYIDLSTLPKFLSSIKISLYILFILTLLGIFLEGKQKGFSDKTFLALLIVALFYVVYAFSPFFFEEDQGGYIVYRHLTYITPLVSLVIIKGLSALKYKVALAPFLLLCILQISSVFEKQEAPINTIFTKATGWVLGTKFGHKPSILKEIIINDSENKDLLIQGIGWGTSSSLFNSTKDLTKKEIELRVDYLVELINSYPVYYKKELAKGVNFSFGKNVGPKLDPKLLIKVQEKLNNQ